MKRKTLLASITRRLEDLAAQSPVSELKRFEPELYMDTLISVVYLYTRPKKGAANQSIFLTEIISAIGHSVRSKLKMKRDSAKAAKVGAFLLYTFEENSYLRVILGQGSKGHNTYIVVVDDDKGICNLWAKLPANGIEKLPATVPYEGWTTSRHVSGLPMVKTGDKDVLDKITQETHPIVFECLNRAQEIGWTVNTDLYNVQKWALQHKVEAFAEIWEMQNPQAKATKLREAKTILEIAQKLLGETFYHLYYYDFRGRKYPTSAYLHEQGTDQARGLLLRKDAKAIGRMGFKWLLVSIASNWAGDAGRPDGAKTDKIPLDDRVAWAEFNEEVFIGYAESPRANQAWMRADKPWQFLAACMELKRFRDWQASFFDDYVPVNIIDNELGKIGVNPYDYESHMEVYIDGSNNGSQHLAALTLDEETAPHVNLVHQDLPGDLYKYIADFVWEIIERQVAEIDKPSFDACNLFIDELLTIKRQVRALDVKDPIRTSLIENLKMVREKNKDLMAISGPIYWSRFKDNKARRKVVKRNVMTIPYGGTAYGLGQQQISDARKHGIDLLNDMEHKWGSYLGRLVFESCKESMEKPMKLLAMFEAAGKAAEQRGEFLSWTLPLTNFPVVQYYVEGVVKKMWVQYGPPRGPRLSTGYYENTLQLNICFIENTVPSKGKQAQGASPNAIHSLDAAHLMLTIHQCSFPVTTIHDSYGCLLADMPQLFRIVREAFVTLYEQDPLKHLVEDVDGNLEGISFGNLDITAIYGSEYGFC